MLSNQHFGYQKLTIEQPLLKDGEIVKDKKGVVKPDSKLRDYERIPLEASPTEYFEREVKPFSDQAWFDKSNIKIGYEINFNKEFYKFTPPRPLDELKNELESLNNDIKKIIETL